MSANETAFSLYSCSHSMGSWVCLVMRAAPVHSSLADQPLLGEQPGRMACHHLDAVIEGRRGLAADRGGTSAHLGPCLLVVGR